LSVHAGEGRVNEDFDPVWLAEHHRREGNWMNTKV